VEYNIGHCRMAKEEGEKKMQKINTIGFSVV
jgi:hypothetical protein